MGGAPPDVGGKQFYSSPTLLPRLGESDWAVLPRLHLVTAESLMLFVTQSNRRSPEIDPSQHECLPQPNSKKLWCCTGWQAKR
ncbi:hypothetical protein JAAARDRAFT_36489 [Jaapia argillacea MUCL 33604]|uniref:Uncharacterized protein n=1 Tax=Jaapia argillacea MUCL 33604 TaxID=933084 RepID=A0A067PR74_9AGAM|nr:hypothetical protein JAAARDRAFT_36489 [Jaapia argillacea MUCL 33604]